jgi:hypothetical protein
MAEQQPEGDDVLTKVAKTVGAALGTVASAASEIIGGNEEPAQAASGRAQAPAKRSKPERPQNASANPPQARARERMKAKRAKHRRKLHRKTRG